MCKLGRLPPSTPQEFPILQIRCELGICISNKFLGTSDNSRGCTLRTLALETWFSRGNRWGHLKVIWVLKIVCGSSLNA